MCLISLFCACVPILVCHSIFSPSIVFICLPRPSRFSECCVLPVTMSCLDIVSPFVSCLSRLLSLSLPLMLPPVGSCVMFLHFLFYCESLVFPCSVCLVVLPLWRQVHSCQLYSPCVLTSLVILLCIYVPHGCACPRVPSLYNFPV